MTQTDDMEICRGITLENFIGHVCRTLS